MTTQSGVLELLAGSAWALEPHVFAQLVAVVERHVGAVKLDPDAVAAIMADARSPRNQRRHSDEMRVIRDVAVVPVHGVISKRARMVGGLSQPRGTSVEAIRSALDEAMRDPGVRAVVLDVDSPGGSVDGVHELAEDIRAMRADKPIASHVDGMAASAAYWIASQTYPLNVTASSLIGSVGVYATVVDSSRAADREGYAVHVIGSAPGKGDGTPGTPWTNEQAERLQGRIDGFHRLFLDAIESGRDATARATAERIGGDVLLGAEAVKQGLADGVAKFMDTVRTVASAPVATVVQVHQPDGGTMKTKTTPPTEPAATDGRPGTDPANTPPTDTSPPAPATEPEPEPAPEPEPTNATVAPIDTGAAAERERCASILALATPSQATLAARLIAEGTAWPQAREALTADPRRNAHADLDRATRSTSEPFDQGADPTTDASTDPERRRFRADHIAVQTFGDTDEGFARWQDFERRCKAGSISMRSR